MYNQDINPSPDLESILNDQFGRLSNKEHDVHSKIRASKHTAKHLSSYLEKRSEIEAKYMKEITNLSDNFAQKIDESDNISKAWIAILKNNKLQCEQRRKYLKNLQKEQQIFNEAYIEQKTAENVMAKQIENDKKVLLHSQRKLDKIMREIQSVQNELKKMDERRRNERRDRLNNKELKRFKELRIKLASLESDNTEKSTNHWKTRNEQKKAMTQNVKIFLKEQIHHFKSIKRVLFDLESYQSDLYINCNQINKKKLSVISEINPVEDVLDWISSIHMHSSTPRPSDDEKKQTQSATPWIPTGSRRNHTISIKNEIVSVEESASATDNSRTRSASMDVIQTNNYKFSFINTPLMKERDLLNSALIREYWMNAFPCYADDESMHTIGQSLTILDESPSKYCLYSTVDDDRLLSETAHHIKEFKSLYTVKSAYGVYCEMDQLFPCNISYKKLDTFYLKRTEWNKLYFEFLLLGSNFFRNVSPHVQHIWNVIIPQKLNIDKNDVHRLKHFMQPIETLSHSNTDANYMTFNHYLWLISYKTRFEFQNDVQYGAWLRRQLTLIVAGIAWNLYTNHQSKLQWKLYDNITVSYSQIIASLNHQCSKIVNFVDKYPCNHPSDNKELQSFIKNIDCLMEQMSEFEHNKSPSTSNLKLNQTVSSIQSEEDFESQSEIEYLSDDEDENAEGVHQDDHKEETKTPFKTPSKQSEDNDPGYIARYTIRFPQQIARFVLWQLMNILITEKRDNKQKSIDFSEKLEIKIEEEEDDYDDMDKIDEINDKLMIHSKVLSVKSDSNHINKIMYDDLSLIPGTLEPRKLNTVRVMIGEYTQFVDSFESAYCDLFALNPYIVWVFMAKLTVDVCLDHIDFDCDGISMLESVMSIPSESPLSTSLSSPFITLEDVQRKASETSFTNESNTTGDDEDETSISSKHKPKRTTKYHINKKWGKLKKRMSMNKDESSENIQTKKKGKKKKKFRPKKLVKKLSLNIHKRSTSHTDTPRSMYNDEQKEESLMLHHCESMKEILKNTWLTIYECMKENNSSNISNLDNDDAVISHRIIKWILGHLQNWLFSYQSYPISITKDYFHLFIGGQSLISSSITQSVHSMEYILVAATHIKYDAIHDSIMDIRFKKGRQSIHTDSMFIVSEWEMFVDALINWMDIESNNNQSVFEQYRIHPKIGQFILFTLCQRFSTDFKHYIFNTDPFQLTSRKQCVCNNMSYKEIEKQYEIIADFMDPRLITLCDIARKFENNMILNKNLLFPCILNMETVAYHPLYHKMFPSSNYIALSQLGELLESQSVKLLEWTKSLLLKEDWIGMDDDEPFSQSVLHLFNALNLFTNTFFAATRKLQIRTILSNPHHSFQVENLKWSVSKLKDSLIGVIRSCVDYYSNYVLSISGKISDVIPDSMDITDLNGKNLQKSNNFNLKEIYRKSKKSLSINKGKLISSLNRNEEETGYFLYQQKAEILCTRFESIGKAVVLCKSLNHKIKTTWFETSDVLLPRMTPTHSINDKNDHKIYQWINGSIDNLCKTVDHLGNLISFYAIFVEHRVDIVDNLYSSKPALSDTVNEDASADTKKSSICKGGKIVENAVSLTLWSKVAKFFDVTVATNTSQDGFHCIVGKTLGVYLLAIRWIVLHSNKNRKFDVRDHKVIQSDMIPMIKFFSNYLSNDRVGEIRLLSSIDNIIDLMSKSTEQLMNCSKSVIQFEKPFWTKKYYPKTKIKPSISPNDHDVLSIIDSINNPFLNHNNHLFHPSNYKSIISLLPYVITKEKDFSLHILVRRIEKNAQKFVAQELQINNENNSIRNTRNDNTNSDSDSFVSFE